MKTTIILLLILLCIVLQSFSQQMPPIFKGNSFRKIEAKYKDPAYINKCYKKSEKEFMKSGHNLTFMNDSVYNADHNAKIDANFKSIEAKFNRSVFNVKNSKEAEVFFGEKGLSTLRYSQLSGDLSSGSATVEILNDILWVGRFAFGGTVSASKSDKNDTINSAQKLDTVNKIQTFFISGGNAYFNWAVPLIVIGDTSSSFRINGYFFPRLSLLLPLLGQSTEKVTANFNPALELHINIFTLKKMFNIFLQGRVGLVWGTYDFSQSLGLGNMNFFGFGEWCVGINIKSLVSINWKSTLFSPNSLKDKIPGRLCLSLSPF
jgi:hypothetical protein